MMKVKPTYTDLKKAVQNGTIAYAWITEYQRRGMINRGQALALRRLFNKIWQKKEQK